MEYLDFEEGTSRSFLSIFREKSLDAFERSSFDRIRDCIIRLLVWVSISVALVRFDLVVFVLSWYNFAVAKIIFGMLIGWHFRSLPYFARAISRVSLPLGMFTRKNKPDAPMAVFDGVDVGVISRFIFETRSWRRVEAEKLWLSRSSVERLGRLLEEGGVFVRGESNARVLADGYFEGDIFSAILGLVWSEKNEAVPSPTFVRRPVKSENPNFSL